MRFDQFVEIRLGYIDQMDRKQIDRHIDRQVKNGKTTKKNRPQKPQKPQGQVGKHEDNQCKKNDTNVELHDTHTK